MNWPRYSVENMTDNDHFWQAATGMSRGAKRALPAIFCEPSNESSLLSFKVLQFWYRCALQLRRKGAKMIPPLVSFWTLRPKSSCAGTLVSAVFCSLGHCCNVKQNARTAVLRAWIWSSWRLLSYVQLYLAMLRTTCRSRIVVLSESEEWIPSSIVNPEVTSSS